MLKKGKNRARTWFKCSNNTLVSSIIDIIKNLDSVEFIKVKGHSDCLGNNIVDSIAKKACEGKSDIVVKRAQTANIIYRPT